MKPKININKPGISSEEIAKGKDFGQLMSTYTMVAPKPFFKSPWFFGGSGTALVVAAIVLTNVLSTPDAPITENSTADNQIVVLDSNATAEDAPIINPPIEGVDITFDSYTVDTDKGETIKHFTGSEITIPASAFIDANGNPVKGKVEIRYREFHDVADLIVCGIPMTYNDKGEETTFESAGMIQIFGYQDGEPVYIHPDKEIDVKMASNDPSTKFNLYVLEKGKKDWTYLGKDKVVSEDKNDVQLLVNEGEVDIDKQDNLFASAEQTKAKNEVVDTEEEKKELKKEVVVIQKDIKKIKKTEPKKMRPSFDLDIKDEEFPELAVYKGAVFEVGKENTNFTEEIYEVEWSNLELAKGSKEGTYVIILSVDDRTEKLIVTPVSGPDHKKNMAKYEASFDKYSKKLVKRKADEKLAKKRYDAKVKEYEKMLAEYEKRQKEWEAAYKKQQEAQAVRQAIYRTFSVNNFGTYNCDSPQKWPKGNTIACNFLDQDGNEVEIATLYMVEKNKNLYFTINMRNDITFNPRSKTMFLGITKDSKLVKYTYDQCARLPLNPSSRIDLKFYVSDVKAEKPEDIRAALSI